MKKIFPFLRSKSSIIRVLRLPPRKILRTIQLGLTCGFLFAALMVIFYQNGHFITSSAVLKMLIILLLFLATYFGGWSAAGAFIIWLITVVIGNESALRTLMMFYLAGFLFGAILAQLYNYSVYWILLLRKQYKVAFFFDPARKVNIIKSPREKEEIEDWATEEEKEKHKLYHYRLSEEPPAPFTITIIANPNILLNAEDGNKSPTIVGDPIINDLNLFLLSVDKALHSFEIDPVMGRPEIWSRIRVVAIFDPDLKNNIDSAGHAAFLLKAFEFQLTQNDVIQSANILAPATNMWARFNSMTSNIAERMQAEQPHVLEDIQKVIEDTDILFAFSANTDYIRSSALFADGKDKELDQKVTDEFTPFTIAPHIGPNSEVRLNSSSLSLLAKREGKHEHGVLIPGKVALNVLTASRKTYIHEFAHAMSSAQNGSITDEYYDTWDIDVQLTLHPDNVDTAKSPFYVNRLERIRNGGKIPAIPRTFVEYNGNIYQSDIHHPSGEENWLGYFPERTCCSDGCIMDRTYGSYQFDDLLSQFIYDRMMAKVNRNRNRL
ncbi:hypothetical protein EH223_14420 [candidate division KSB1 bacterium]|nr:hypothetical protein [candidate division KSB1 bacterium]RQW01675.1 MAG: hypothetical protein EH223_14420 [candidate division KSB1 bacterium]